MLPTAGVRLLAPITNTVSLDGGIHSPFLRRATIQYAHLAWLPLLIRNH
jgi:hypothetical protein